VDESTPYKEQKQSLSSLSPLPWRERVRVRGKGKNVWID